MTVIYYFDVYKLDLQWDLEGMFKITTEDQKTVVVYTIYSSDFVFVNISTL